jgi:PAS domain-containing protein
MNQTFSLKNKISFLFLALLGILLANYLAFYIADKSLDKSMIYLEIGQENTLSLHKSVFFARNIVEGRKININNLNHEIKLLDQRLSLLKNGGDYTYKGKKVTLPPSTNKAFSEFLRDWQDFRGDLQYITQNSVQIDSQQVYYVRKDNFSIQDNLLDHSNIDDLSIPDDLVTQDFTSDDEFIDSLFFDENFGQESLNFDTEINDMLDYEKAGFVLKNTLFKTPTLEAQRRITAIVRNAESLSLLGQSVANNDALAFNNSQKQIRVAIFLGLIVNLLLLSLAYWFTLRNTIFPLKKIQLIIKELAEGKLRARHQVRINDELGEVFNDINQLAENLEQISHFATQVGNENFSADLAPRSKEDDLVYALLDMKSNLKRNTKENFKRNWVNQGMQDFGRILRQGTDLKGLSREVISNLIQYLTINQGGIFILQENESLKKQELNLLASYAYNKLKYEQKTIQIGEGLIGQVVLDKESLYLDKVPDGYTKITSGLGETTPQILLITPLLLNNEVYGVIELASFRHFEEHELTFITRLSENIASSIASLNANLKAKTLLEKTQTLAKQTKAEEVTLIQRMKSLAYDQSEMLRIQQTIKEQETNLNGVLNHTDILIIALDKEYNITVINRPYAAMLERLRGSKVTLGMNLLDVLSPAEQEEWLPYYRRAMHGETYTIIRNIKDYKNADIYYQISFHTIYDKNQKIRGFSIFTKNITWMTPIRWEGNNKIAKTFK